jgi:hypothetical protein
VAAAAVTAAAVRAATGSAMTPAGTEAVRVPQPEPARGRAWLVALVATLALGGGSAGAWLFRARSGPSSPALENPKVVLAAPLTTLKPLRAETDVPPLEPTSTASSASTGSTTPVKNASPPPVTPTPAARPNVASAPAALPPSNAPIEPTPAVTVASTPATAAPVASAPVAAPSATAPALPAVAAPFDASHAHVEASVLNAGGGATASSVQRAVSRKVGQWTHCYRTALERRNERIEGSGVLHLTTDESGNVVGARMAGFDAMPGVKSCVVNDSHVHFDNVDTGDAWADIQLTFRAE